MDFAFSPEQEELRAAAKALLADQLPSQKLAQLADSELGWDPNSWQLISEQGWLGMSAPESAGGLGLSTLDEAVLFEEAGAALYPGPFFSSVALALPLLLASEAGAEYVAGLSDGSQIFTLAWAEARSDSITQTDLTTRSGAAGLSGTKLYVPDLAISTHAVVTALGSDGVEVHVVELAANGVTIKSDVTIDRTRRVGELTLDSAPSTLLLTGTAAEAALAATRLRAMSAAALEAVGVAQRCLDLATAYASEREQFGRPIGTNQAISHRVADMFSDVELARSLAYWAAWSVEFAPEECTQSVLAAKSRACEAAVSAAESAIQVHGGIGMTWEHILHRYYKRAIALATFEGSPAEQRAELADLLLS